MKRCPKCQQNKSINLFSRSKYRKDGYENYCIECRYKLYRIYYYKNQQELLEKKREYFRNIKGTEVGKKRNKRLYKAIKSNPVSYEKQKVRWTLAYQIRIGAIKREPCEICGEAKTHAHHHKGYDFPLEVRWLCPLHHRQVHKEQLIALKEKLGKEDKQPIWDALNNSDA